jgi:hypothetical protein
MELFSLILNFMLELINKLKLRNKNINNIIVSNNYGYYLTLLQILCLMLVVSGCGQSGPLYLPEENISYKINNS